MYSKPTKPLDDKAGYKGRAANLLIDNNSNAGKTDSFTHDNGRSAYSRDSRNHTPIAGSIYQ
jgi:hypothetical protein